MYLPKNGTLVYKIGKSMVYQEENSSLKIVIPMRNMNELAKYQKGLLGVLHKVEVDHRDLELAENLKYVYLLLTHLSKQEYSNSMGNKIE